MTDRSETPLTISDLRHVLTSIIDTITGSSLTDTEKNRAALYVLESLFDGGELSDTLLMGGYNNHKYCLQVLGEVREGIPATKEDVAAKLLQALADAKANAKENKQVIFGPGAADELREERAVARLTETAIRGALGALGFTQRGTMRRDHAKTQDISR
jgi:hypothetical protein